MPQPPAPNAGATIRRWIERELDSHPPRATSLIVTVWGDALAPHGGAVWLSTLFRLLASFRLNERLVRTSVFRLARDGWLAGESVGRRSRYRLTADGARRFAQAYRRVYTPPSQPWDGSWEIVVSDVADPHRRRLLRDELAWEGFGTLGATLHARPARERSMLPRIVTALDVASSVTVFRGSEARPRTARALADRVADAWPLAQLASDHRQFIGRFTGVTRALREVPGPARDPEQTFVVRTLLVHAYRRVRLRDPQLPLALLPAPWPGAAAYALCRDLYRLATPGAEAHLHGVARADGVRLERASAALNARFPLP